MREHIRWGVLATGAIGQTFARGLEASETGTLAAVGSRSQERADAFAAEFGQIHAHGSYESLLADDAIDAIYISTPHPYHATWTIAALEAGKHVLVEKPIALNEPEATRMIAAAVRHERFLMEAYMYRCHPQTARLVELIREGAIGDVRLIKATFSFGSLSGFNPDSRIWSNALGGGGILDVGGYTTSISRLVAGAATGQPFADPTDVTGTAHLHPETGVDAWAVATLRFEHDITASLFTGVGLTQKSDLLVYGEAGWLEVPSPYCHTRRGESPGKILLHAKGKIEEIGIACPVTSFTLEADVVGRAIAARQQEATPMPWADTLGNIRTQDQWREAVGLTYEAERT